MAHLAAGNSFDCNWTCTSSKHLSLEDSTLQELASALCDFKARLPTLRSVLFDLRSGFYRYEWTLADGRIWKQNIKISTAVTMNFAVPDYFSLEEYLGHRRVRDLLIALTQSRAVTLFTASWS